jgi:hypothetical protein
VAAAAEPGRDLRQIHIGLGPHRHRPLMRVELLEHRGHFGLLCGPHDVDDALDLLWARADPILIVDDGVDQPATTDSVGQQSRRAQDTRQHRQPHERMAVDQGPTDRRVVHTDLDQPGRQPKGASAGPAERPGVSGKPGVDAVPDIAVYWFPPRVEKFGNQERGGIR